MGSEVLRVGEGVADDCCGSLDLLLETGVVDNIELDECS